MFYQRELSLAELQSRAPSIFAGGAASNTSSRYLYIPTGKLVEAMVKADFMPVACKQVNGKDRDHGKHVIHMTHRSLQDKLQGKAELPLIRIQNSHDGKSSLQLDTGFFRLVCSNGLVMPEGQLSSARIIHKVGMENDVIEASYRILESFPEQIRQIEAMKQVKLDKGEQQTLADSSMRIVFDAETIEANESRNRSLAGTLLAPRRQADVSSDLWTTFNRIQENAIKGGRRVYSASGNFRAMREVKAIDREKQINVELMTLAQKMAELKQSLAA